jgi:TRAP-type mannitol/chloroaromatic compound transport system permease small subunit
MKRVLRIIDKISEVSGKSFSWLIFTTMAIIGFEIIMRLFGKAQIWVYDISLFTAGVVYVVGGAYTLLRERHVKMDVLYTRLSPRKQAILDVITFPGFLVFCGILVWAGSFRAWESFLQQERLVTGFMPIVWPVRWMIPLGGLLIVLQGLAKFIRDIHMAIKGAPLD